MDALGKDNFNAEELKNILLLRKRLQNFQLNITEVSEAPIKEVLGLYTRINTSGRQLGWVDSFATPILLNIVPDLKIKISNYLNSNLKEYEGFENLFDTEFFLQTIVRTIHPKYFNSLRESSFKEIDLYTKEAIIEALDRTQKGSLAVVKLLKNQLRMLTSKTIKKDFSVLLLTIALGSLDILATHKDQKTLIHYFLLTNIFDFYSSTQAQKIKSEHFDKIKEAIILSQDIVHTFNAINNELETSIKKENSNKNYFNIDTLHSEKYNSGRNTKGFIALEYLLTYNRATTFTDFNAPVDFANSHKHHIYPNAYLRDSQANLEEDVVNSIGNITFITKTTNLEFSNKSPMEYFDIFAKPSSESLALHFFPEDYLDYNKLTLDNAKLFIRERLAKLADEFNSFLNKFEE